MTITPLLCARRFSAKCYINGYQCIKMLGTPFLLRECFIWAEFWRISISSGDILKWENSICRGMKSVWKVPGAHAAAVLEGACRGFLAIVCNTCTEPSSYSGETHWWRHCSANSVYQLFQGLRNE